MSTQRKTIIAVAALLIAGAVSACSDDQAKQADQKAAGANAQAAAAQQANKDAQGVDPFMAPGTTRDGKYHPVAEGAYPAMGPPVPDAVIAEETKKWDEEQKQLAKMGGPMGMAAAKAQQQAHPQAQQQQQPVRDSSTPASSGKPN